MSVIDKTAFDKLKEMSGAEFIDEPVGAFLEDDPKMIAEIKSAHVSGDVESFRRAAHLMNSNAFMLGREMNSMKSETGSKRRVRRMSPFVVSLWT